MSSESASDVVDLEETIAGADCFFLMRPAPPRPYVYNGSRVRQHLSKHLILLTTSLSFFWPT